MRKKTEHMKRGETRSGEWMRDRRKQEKRRRNEEQIKEKGVAEKRDKKQS